MHLVTTLAITQVPRSNAPESRGKVAMDANFGLGIKPVFVLCDDIKVERACLQCEQASLSKALPLPISQGQWRSKSRCSTASIAAVEGGSCESSINGRWLRDAFAPFDMRHAETHGAHSQPAHC